MVVVLVQLVPAGMQQLVTVALVFHHQSRELLLLVLVVAVAVLMELLLVLPLVAVVLVVAVMEVREWVEPLSLVRQTLEAEAVEEAAKSMSVTKTEPLAVRVS